jgi:lysophospholipase L1-like esterase
VHRLGPRRQERHYRRTVACIAVLLGVSAVLGTAERAPSPDAAALATLARAVPANAGPAAPERSAEPRTSVTTPLFDRRPAPDGPGRPPIRVAPAKPEVVARAGSGATAVFLGDSYTTGWNGAGIAARGWPKLVANALGWKTMNLAVAGTGFVNPGWTNQPLGSRVAEAIRLKPDIVFVAAGHNDSRWSDGATARAADRAIDRLRRGLPDAMIVIVGPIWPSGRPPARCLELRDHLRHKAASIDAEFIDPLREGWFAGANGRLIGADGIHPTNAGHRQMAERVLADLATSLRS